MFQFLRGIVLIAAMILNCGTIFGQEDPLSANARLPGCRDFINTSFGNDDKLFGQAMHCAGLVEGIAFAASGLCIDPRSTGGQNIRVVVKYIDDRPARMHESFAALALEALRAAWPCKK